jgi:hypothetical protein
MSSRIPSPTSFKVGIRGGAKGFKVGIRGGAKVGIRGGA